MAYWIVLTPLFFLVILFIWWFFFKPLPPKSTPARSVAIKDGITRRNAAIPQLVEALGDMRTLDQLFNAAVEKFGTRDCLGTRKEFGHIEKKKIVKVNGKETEKIWKIARKANSYEWQTYAEVSNEVSQFGNGLVSLGFKKGDKMSLFMDTCPHWQKSAQACFRYGFPVVTSYASLGEDALAFTFNQTKSACAITSAKLLPTVLKSAESLPFVACIVYTDDISAEIKEKVESFLKKNPKVKILRYEEVLQLGSSKRAPVKSPEADDLAVIMYTSGSTGNPKGVLITHNNLVSVCASAPTVIPGIGPEDTYIAFLPLAHVLELMAECALLSKGARIGYSNAQHLVNDSVVDMDDKPLGDFCCLQPTLAAAVPLIMDRMRNSVLDKVNASAIGKFIFNLAYSIKKRRYLAGLPSTILDKLIFSKVRGVLGGKIRLMLSGGAPLGTETQEFMNVVFCVPIGQGYGATETCGGSCITHPEDVTSNNVGAPLPCNQIRLVDVPEMGYFNADVLPRGEIHIGGKNVTMGYFDMPDKNAEDFYAEDGIRWFKTGDIGRWNADGTLSIIDRKKDLIKLAGGEYVALGSVESKLKTCPLLDNACVYCDSSESYPVSIIVPNRVKLFALAKTLNIHSESVDKLVTERSIIQHYLAELKDVSKKSKLKPFETISNILLTADEWTPANGMLTDAMKVKRSDIYKKYAKELASLYKH